MTPEYLLTHGWHRDSDDPNTWRRNKDLRVPANTEGPGLSFEEAARKALTEPLTESDRDASGGQARRVGGGSVSAVPPLAVSAEARAIQEAVGYILDLALNYRPAYGCKSAQERLSLAKNAATSLDALLARVAEAERDADAMRQLAHRLEQDVFDYSKRSHDQADRAERAEESLAFAKDTAHDERDGRLRAEAEARVWKERTLRAENALLRGGDTG